MSTLRLDEDASLAEDEVIVSDEESDSCSSDRAGKGAGRAGRPRGKGRPKRLSRGARRKSEESEEW